jgi:predicted phage terminase large subunit-like protein
VRGGNTFKVENVRRENPASWPQGLRWARCWDMASSVKQRAGDDPDWTVGVLGAIHRERDPITGATLPHLYVRDVIFLREEAPRRNARIRMAADTDGSVPICVEAFGAYKDAAADLANVLHGVRTVRQLRPPGDKMVKAQPLEPIFEAGNVHVPADAPWLNQWLTHFEEFPAGAHDDAVDATALVWHAQAGGCGILM